MKQADLVRLLLRKGVIFVRHGANHDWYKNLSTGISEAVPRHREIKEQLAKKIIKNLS
ncbi:MAG: type II toxin-antitoxin system HicA family toxin [Treponema sp.]|nr:type II toxin-antitoxin system HicA family toxin [Treponema sp.]